MTRSRMGQNLIEPFGIGGTACGAPIIVGGAVIPPNAAALSQRLLCGIDSYSRSNSFLGPGGVADGAPCGHEFLDEAAMNFRVEAGVTESPKAAAHHEIPPIRGRRVISVLS